VSISRLSTCLDCPPLGVRFGPGFVLNP
jgi:hypothetical protein